MIQNAERIMVKFSDGRSLQARVLGIDPDTDIALIKVDARNLPVAPMGDSETLRVGEWVCAIGNPLAYEHTVTVGVVSYLGRKLFDSSLDNYIQTDAAINFGNSGGPLINGRGEVVGINSAISQRASNIGFAVPINEARSILRSFAAEGRVARGYMGVTLSDVDPDLQRSLRLTSTRGALVQDVDERVARPSRRTASPTISSPASTTSAWRTTTKSSAKSRGAARERWRGCRSCATAAARPLPCGSASVQAGRRSARSTKRIPVRPSSNAGRPAGLERARHRQRHIAAAAACPSGVSGVVVTRVDPLSSAYDAGHSARPHRAWRSTGAPSIRPTPTTALARAASPGDVLAVYVYIPATDQRSIRAVRVDAR